MMAILASIPQSCARLRLRPTRLSRLVVIFMFLFSNAISMASATGPWREPSECEDAEELPLEGDIFLRLIGARDAQSQAELDAVSGAYIMAYNAVSAEACGVPGSYYEIDTAPVITTNPKDMIGLPVAQRRELQTDSTESIEFFSSLAWLLGPQGRCRGCTSDSTLHDDTNARIRRKLTGGSRPPRPPRPPHHPPQEEQCACNPPPRVAVMIRLKTEIQKLVDSGVLTTVIEATGLVELQKVECSTGIVDVTGTIVFDAEFDLATATQEQKDIFLEDAKDTYNSYNLVEDDETCDTSFRRITRAIIDEEASTANELVVRYEGLCRGCTGTEPLFDDFTTSSSTVRRHFLRHRHRFLQDATNLCLCPIGFIEDRPVTSSEYQVGMEVVIEERGNTTLFVGLNDVSHTPSPTESPTASPTGPPTDLPTASPTALPTDLPTASPMDSPTGGSLTLDPRTAIPTIPMGPTVPCVDGNIVEGTDGPDTLLGTPCADILIGHGGNDLLMGFGGDDTIMGGGGKDTIVGGVGFDVISGGEGADLIDGSEGADTITGGGGADNIFGGGGGDKILGGSASDILFGGRGADDIVGGEGEDTIYGDDGSDKIQGNNGDDILLGGTGSDTIMGGDGSDNVDAGDGSDDIFGGEGDDAINAGPGFDTVAGSGGNDVVFGNSGADLIQGEGGDDYLDGGLGIDTLNGGEGDDTVLNEVGGP